MPAKAEGQPQPWSNRPEQGFNKLYSKVATRDINFGILEFDKTCGVKIIKLYNINILIILTPAYFRDIREAVIKKNQNVNFFQIGLDPPPPFEM